MKLFLHDYGGYAFSYQLAEKLAKRGTETHYYHGGAMQAVQRARLRGAGQLHIGSVDLGEPFQKYSFIKRWQQENIYGRLLVKKMAEIRPDIILSANSPLDSQNHLLAYARRNKIPFVFWWQDIAGLAVRALLSQKNRALGWLAGSYYLAMEQSHLRHSRAVIAISEDFHQVAQNWGFAPQKFHILPNWAPLDEIPAFEKQNPWSAQYELQDKFVILYSGILALKHNPQVFVSLAEHFQTLPQVVVIVTSEGPGADWLKEQSQQKGLANLRILPFQPYADYPAMLASADVLFATIEEHAGRYSVPSKVLSYLCAGRPILLSAPLANQAAQMVQKHQLGLACPPADARMLNQLASHLLNNPAQRILFGQNARQYAETHFDIDIISEQFHKILAAL